MFACVSATVSQTIPPLTSETPEFKCHVSFASGEDSVIRFYDIGGLPARFTDDETIAQAAIPDSVRRRVAVVHECVLVSEQFSSPAAVWLEQQLPR
jgi:hypothetical protein